VDPEYARTTEQLRPRWRPLGLVSFGLVSFGLVCRRAARRTARGPTASTRTRAARGLQAAWATLLYRTVYDPDARSPPRRWCAEAT
jgi:hypothetical protein